MLVALGQLQLHNFFRDLSWIKLHGTFKYYVGSFIDKAQADILKNDMRKTGFQGAFVVAFHKDKRISIKEALDLQMKINNHE